MAWTHHLRKAVEGVGRLLGYRVVVAKTRYIHLVTIDTHTLSSYFHRNAIRQLYDEALAKSGMHWSDNFAKQCRHYALIELLGTVLTKNLGGSVAECGCWTGHSTYQMATTLDAHGFGGVFHVFDSFEGGLSEPVGSDRNERRRLTDTEIAAQKAIFESSEEQVGELLAPFEFVTLFKGWIPSRFTEVASHTYCFAHIDVDLYEPTRDSLAFFFPRLVDGGIIVIDDYGYTQFPGARSAVEEFLKSNRVSLFFEIPTGGAFLIK